QLQLRVAARPVVPVSEAVPPRAHRVGFPRGRGRAPPAVTGGGAPPPRARRHPVPAVASPSPRRPQLIDAMICCRPTPDPPGAHPVHPHLAPPPKGRPP